MVRPISRNIVITGTSTGIGRATALLALVNPEVVMITLIRGSTAARDKALLVEHRSHGLRQTDGFGIGHSGVVDDRFAAHREGDLRRRQLPGGAGWQIYFVFLSEMSLSAVLIFLL